MVRQRRTSSTTRRIRLADIDGSGTTDIIYLAPRRRAPLLQPVGQRLERAAAAATSSRASTTWRRSRAVDLLGNGTACLVWSSPLPGDARPADALRRPDGRAEAAPAGHDRSTTSAPKRASSTPPRPSSTCRTSATASRGSRGCRSRCMWSSGSRPTTRSAATASSPATPTTTATSTASSASSAASAWSSSGTPRSSPRSAPTRQLPAGDQHRRRLARAAGAHQDLVSHRRLLGRDRVSDFFAGLLDRHDRGEYYREPGPDRRAGRASAARRHGAARRLDAPRRSAKPAAP